VGAFLKINEKKMRLSQKSERLNAKLKVAAQKTQRIDF
jgi:hypothetical protein